MDQFLLQNAPAAIFTTLLLQYLKNSSWFNLLNVPAGPSDKLQSRINLAASWLAAALVSFGIHYTSHYDPHTGTFELAFQGTVAGLRAGVWEIVQQWVVQHGTYKTVVVIPELLDKIVNQGKV